MGTIEIVLVLAFINYLLFFLNGRKKSSLLCCGLIGYSGKDNYNLDKIKFLMLWNSVERGKDATGIYTPSSGLMKDKEPAGQFFQNKEIRQLVPDNQLMAHVRAKTVGANLAKCAHPFDYEDVVLAHNGTLVDYSALATKFGLAYKDYEVDSQILAYGVNQAFTKAETLEDINVEILTEYKGAAAILFYSKKFDRIFLFKDKERPLCFGRDDRGNMYISSLSEPLRALGMTEVFDFQDNTLYCIDKGDIISRKVYATYEETHKHEYTGKVKTRKEKHLKFPKLKKDQKGIDISATTFKSYHLLGLWLLAKEQTFGVAKGAYEKSAVIKKGRFYRVTGYYEDSARVVQIKDENGNLAQAWITDFDTENCIPNGDYFKLLTNIQYDKDKTHLFSRDEIVVAARYDIEYGVVTLWHEKNQRSYDVSTEYCKPLTYEEAYNYIGTLEIEEADKKKVAEELPLVNELPTVDSSPFFDYEELENDKDNNLGDFIDTSAFLAVLDIVETQVSGLEEDYNANMDLTPKINEIKSTVSSSKDKTYLASLVEKVPNC